MTNIRRKISSKKNVFIAAALIALMAIGSTFAYFVDRDYVANNFTVGDVEISVSKPWVFRQLILEQKALLKSITS